MKKGSLAHSAGFMPLSGGRDASLATTANDGIYFPQAHRKRILLLADPASPHTARWARSLAQQGLEVAVFGLNAPRQGTFSGHEIPIFTMDYPRERMNREGYGISKIVYLRALGAVIQSIREFRPDIVHAHYASSYGLLGALSRFHPYVLSVWGSDVFDFPRKSFMHRALLRYNFRAADRILSTSKIMVQEIGRYTHKTVQVTPFGIDLDQFKPASATRSGFRHGDIVIGTIKKMERIYGLEHLVRAFGIVKRNHPKLPLKLLLVGGGSLERSLKQLVRQLRLERETSFVGEVPISDIPLYHNMISIFASLSLSESFGVSVLEASACERPVVASCVGGLSEVVLHGKTGYLVPAHDSRGAAAALEKLILDSQLRTDMGRRGREFVRRNYNWSDSVAVMMDIYREFEEPPVLHQSNKAGRVL